MAAPRPTQSAAADIEAIIAATVQHATGGSMQPPAHPTVGHKSIIPPTYYPTASQDPTPCNSEDGASEEEEAAKQEVVEPSSSDSESSSSSSSSGVRHRRHGRHDRKKKSHKRRSTSAAAAAACSSSQAPAPAPLRKKMRAAAAAAGGSESQGAAMPRSEQTDRDAKAIAPLPFVRYLQARQTPKACGRCEACKKPPCGVCKACVQNGKRDSEKKPSLKDRRRCEALRCEKDAGSVVVALPAGVPEDKDLLSEALIKASTDLADIGGKIGTPEFNQQEYSELLARIDNLRQGLVILKNRKARRRVKFPVGFHDVWGVISSLEDHRLKFARSVVRQGNSEECRTIEMKRRMRDRLEAAQIDIAHINVDLLCPSDDKQGFLAVIDAPRR